MLDLGDVKLCWGTLPLYCDCNNSSAVGYDVFSLTVHANLPLTHVYFYATSNITSCAFYPTYGGSPYVFSLPEKFGCSGSIVWYNAYERTNLICYSGTITTKVNFFAVGI